MMPIAQLPPFVQTYWYWGVMVTLWIVTVRWLSSRTEDSFDKGVAAVVAVFAASIWPVVLAAAAVAGIGYGLYRLVTIGVKDGAPHISNPPAPPNVAMASPAMVKNTNDYILALEAENAKLKEILGI